MISSTSSSDRTAPRDPLPASSQSAPPQRIAPDRISVGSAALLSSELNRQPEIRPEALVRGRQVMNDPNYPFGAAITSIAQKLVNSPDLSEDAS